jgi:para-nitrobenzyl esterase
VIDGLREAYPTVRPVEIYAHTLNQGGLAYRIDALSLASRKAAQNGAPVYVYMFAWKTPVMDRRPRAFHRSELPFVFDNTVRCAHQTGGTDEARTMAARVSDAWIAFARDGDPNHAAIPRWPVFDATRVPTMVFDDICAVRFDHDRAARLAFEKR